MLRTRFVESNTFDCLRWLAFNNVTKSIHSNASVYLLRPDRLYIISHIHLNIDLKITIIQVVIIGPSQFYLRLPVS